MICLFKCPDLPASFHQPHPLVICLFYPQNLPISFHQSRPLMVLLILFSRFVSFFSPVSPFSDLLILSSRFAKFFSPVSPFNGYAYFILCTENYFCMCDWIKARIFLNMPQAVNKVLLFLFLVDWLLFCTNIEFHIIVYNSNFIYYKLVTFQAKY